MTMATSRVSPLKAFLGAIFFFAANVFAVSAVLGVDLGTEYIKAALVKPGIPLDIVLTKDSRRKETSAVCFKPSRNAPLTGQFPERAYGADAMALSARFPGDVYPNLKTILGLSVDNPIVQEYAARHPALQLEAHSTRNTAAFKSKASTAEQEAWMVEELLAMELQSIQKNAELAAGNGFSVRSIVLTVPPFYTVDEKRAVQTAAELAGLKVLSLVSDGLAVGLNYATSRQFPSVSDGSKPEYNMVFDMGAGSTKTTVMKFQSRSVKDYGKVNKTIQEVQVMGTSWDRTLGGDALNYLILDDMIAKFLESKGAQKISVAGEDFRAHGRAIAKLSNQVEKVRHVLSANQNTHASFEGLYEDIDFKYKISRTDFEDLASAYAERIGLAVSNALKAAGLEASDLDSLILHGGATRTPFVQKTLEKVLGSADKIRSNVNSDESAVFGAGFRAAELSPSFRVKEIRISEGASYPAGIKWTTSKDKLQRQRLWTAISPQGAAPKEVTFTDVDDFTATFYQQIDSEDKDVKKLITKNLTATVAAIKDKYPTCLESDIQFKLGVKLSGETGEVEIARAAVECQAEVEKGFVDGVKNLFGFGKKDQKPLKDGETEGSEEELKEEAAKESSSEESTESSTASEGSEATGSTEELKAGVKTKETVFIPVDFTLENLGIPDLTKAQLAKSKDRLKAFAASDKARLQREEVLNQLEGYTYKIRDLLENESFIGASTEAVRNKLSELASEASDWLYGDGADASKDELKAKLKKLQDIVNPVQKRIDEAAQRPELVSNLKDALNKTSGFITSIQAQIDEHDSWHKSASDAASASAAIESSVSSAASPETTTIATGDFDGLEDEDSAAATARQMEDLIKESGPIPPLYEPEDLDEIIALHKSTMDWLEELEAKQAKLAATANPVLFIKDIKTKLDKLEKAGIEIAMKGAKKVEAKAKQAKKDKKSKAKKEKKSKTGSDGSQESLKFNADDFAGKDGKPMSEEDLEQLIKKLKEEHGEGKQEHKRDEL